MDSVRSLAGGGIPVLTVTLYLDVYWFVNFVMDLLILGLAARILKLWPGVKRLAAGALTGSLWACLMAVVPFWDSVIFWGIGSAFMVLTAFGGWPVTELRSRFSECGKEFLRRLTAVMGISLTVGGVFAAIKKTPGQWPFWQFLLTAAGIWFGGRALLEFMRERAELRKQCYQVTLSYKGREKTVEAFLDTGNRLYEPYGHQPVHVLSACACVGFCETLSQVIYIPYRSVGKAYGLMPGIRIDEMKVCQDGEVIRVWKQPWIGISREPVSPDGQYEMLLHG